MKDNSQKQIDKKIFFIGVALLLMFTFIAVFDYFVYPDSFWLFTLAIPGFFAVAIYMFTKKFWFSASVYGAFFWMLRFGVEDLFYYVFFPFVRGEPIPATMPHLTATWEIGGVARLLGYTNVTWFTLIVSAIIGIVGMVVILYLGRRYLWKRK